MVSSTAEQGGHGMGVRSLRIPEPLIRISQFQAELRLAPVNSTILEMIGRPMEEGQGRTTAHSLFIEGGSRAISLHQSHSFLDSPSF